MTYSPLLIAIVALPLASCASLSRSVSRGGGCASSHETSDVQTAINVLSLKDTLGYRLRRLAGPSWQSSGGRERVQWVTEDRACRAAGASAQRWRAADTYSVFRVGETYWVRGSSWAALNVLDGTYKRIATFIDQ